MGSAVQFTPFAKGRVSVVWGDNADGPGSPWWIGDHEPRHVHVFDSKGNLLGRVTLGTVISLDSWTPPKKVLFLIKELQKENRI